MISKFNRLYLDLLNGQKNRLSLSENEIESLKIDKSLINESIFKDEIFNRLFEYVKNLDDDKLLMTPKQLADFFPIKSAIRKRLSKTYFNKNFYLSIINPDSIDDIMSHLIWWSKLNANSRTLKRMAVDVWNAFSDANALFFSTLDKGIMFLKKNEFTLEEFKHEFIHYYRWSTGDDLDEEIDLNQLIKDYEKPLHMFMNMFDLEEDNLEYFCVEDEFETLLNSAIDELRNSSFSKDIIMKTLFFDRKKSNSIRYLENIKNSDLFDLIKKSSSLQFIVFNVIINYNVMKMKIHIFSQIKA